MFDLAAAVLRSMPSCAITSITSRMGGLMRALNLPAAPRFCSSVSSGAALRAFVGSLEELRLF